MKQCSAGIVGTGRIGRDSLAGVPSPQSLIPFEAPAKLRKIWFPFYLDDYDSDTSHLSFEEHGAYLALLRHYYRTGNPLDAIASVLHRVCRAFAGTEKAAIDRMLERFFTLRDGKYHHKRVDLEIAKANLLSNKRADSASKRWACKSNANAMQKHTQSQEKQDARLGGMLSMNEEQKLKARPTLDQVEKYCAERQNKVDAKQWFDYYCSNGWKVGRSTMRDWKAAVRTWERNGVRTVGTRSDRDDEFFRKRGISLDTRPSIDSLQTDSSSVQP